MTASPRPDEAHGTELPGRVLDSPVGEGRPGLPSVAAATGGPAEPPHPRPIGSYHRELGLTLYRLRLERGLSLRALARCLGYSSHSAFADFEKARRMPGEPLLVAYERLFELPLGPLVALRTQALAERAAWLTAIRESTVLGTTPTVGTATLHPSARSPVPATAPPPEPPGTAPTGVPSADVTRVNPSARDASKAADASDASDASDVRNTRNTRNTRNAPDARDAPPVPTNPANLLARARRKPKPAGGLAGLGAAVAHLFGRRPSRPTEPRSAAQR
ncbi:helix-turn-helix domain-containing protein [Embleya sp. AB8]|uniref:helix-turn-helix domain-containing protein n=1 Tax=Embleya sp. AB8 TaxID=3156304 RepID=UPI003C795C7E